MKKRDETNESSDVDAEAFARAMADEHVVPLRSSNRRVQTKALVSLPPAAGRANKGEDDAGTDDDSEASFAAHGVDRREIRKLKRGEYAAAERHDLHGLTADAASAAVRRVLGSSGRNRRRCICFVHGRGLRSPGGVAVLKSRVRALLRAHTAVLAFADAPPADGESGAVYVLLRRRV